MTPFSKVASWDVVHKKAYWDRQVPLGRWRERVAQGHRSYLPDAVKYMEATEFVVFYGKEAFVQDWPRLRTLVPQENLRFTPLYNLVWSKLAGGGFNLMPFPDFYVLSPRRRDFLKAVAQKPGRNIYAVAKSLDMPYKRAHEHAHALMQEHKIRGREVSSHGRRQTRLYPGYLPVTEPAHA